MDNFFDISWKIWRWYDFVVENSSNVLNNLKFCGCVVDRNFDVTAFKSPLYDVNFWECCYHKVLITLRLLRKKMDRLETLKAWIFITEFFFTNRLSLQYFGIYRYSGCNIFPNWRPRQKRKLSLTFRSLWRGFCILHRFKTFKFLLSHVLGFLINQNLYTFTIFYFTVLWGFLKIEAKLYVKEISYLHYNHRYLMYMYTSVLMYICILQYLLYIYIYLLYI